MMYGQIQPGVAAVTPANDADLANVKMIEEANDVGCHEIEANLSIVCRAAPMPAAIQRNHAIVLRSELRDKVTEIA
jgi:hypothetical protein